MAKVAIHTALSRTSLEPHLIYDGSSNEFTEWVEARKVSIIRWRSSLFKELCDFGRRIQHPGITASLPGVFLRVDLPLIVKELGLNHRVFYTDCDVLFRDEVVPDLQRSECDDFAVAPEFTVEDYELMNTGVMLMNTRSLRDSLPEFHRFIIANMDGLRADSWDQSAYRQFYRAPDGKRFWNDLPPSLNWKPYWGDYSNAKIIHFHGPKPYQRDYIDSHYPELKHLIGGSYLELVNLYQALLAEAG